jgi:hypothetical protein
MPETKEFLWKNWVKINYKKNENSN